MSYVKILENPSPTFKVSDIDSKKKEETADTEKVFLRGFFFLDFFNTLA